MSRRGRRGMVDLSSPVPAPSEVDASLPLINLVFLILISLLLAGTLRPPLPTGFEMAETILSEGQVRPQLRLVMAENGKLWSDGEPITMAAVSGVAQHFAPMLDTPLPVLIDRRASVQNIAALTSTLQSAGVAEVTLVIVQAEDGGPFAQPE